MHFVVQGKKKYNASLGFTYWLWMMQTLLKPSLQYWLWVGANELSRDVLGIYWSTVLDKVKHP